MKNKTHSYKHIFITAGLVAIISACLFTMTACAPNRQKRTVNGRDVYSAQFPQSPLEYTSYLNKQIEVVTNQLSTQILLAESVCKQSYPTKDAIDSASASIDIIDEALFWVSTMQPPDGYDDNRTATLTLMQNAKSSIQAYITELTTGDKNKIGNARDVMQSDYIAITGQFNAYWQ